MKNIENIQQLFLTNFLASHLPSLFVILYFSTSGTSLSKQAFPRFVSCIRVERIVLVSNNLRIIRNICILKRLENLIKHLLNMDRDYKCIFNIQCKIVSLYLISSSRTKKLGQKEGKGYGNFVKEIDTFMILHNYEQYNISLKIYLIG